MTNTESYDLGGVNALKGILRHFKSFNQESFTMEEVEKIVNEGINYINSLGVKATN